MKYLLRRLNHENSVYKSMTVRDENTKPSTASVVISVWLQLGILFQYLCFVMAYTIRRQALLATSGRMGCRGTRTETNRNINIEDYFKYKSGLRRALKVEDTRYLPISFINVKLSQKQKSTQKKSSKSCKQLLRIRFYE